MLEVVHATSRRYADRAGLWTRPRIRLPLSKRRRFHDPGVGEFKVVQDVYPFVLLVVAMTADLINQGNRRADQQSPPASCQKYMSRSAPDRIAPIE